MNDVEVQQIALELLMDHIERGPKFSHVAAKIPNYVGDGASLEDAMKVQVELEDMIEDLLEGISKGLKGQ